MKILAVDDDPIFLELLKSTLVDLGYEEVELAESGQDALDLIQDPDSDFDCFLLDIKMPRMDGIQLCRNIRVLPGHRRTPIVMNTILSEKPSIDNAFAAGATDYLTKPIDRVEIRARLGMVRNLIQVRGRYEAVAAVQREVLAASYLRGFSYPFELENVTGALSYIGLKNYLLTLGKMRSHSVAATGIHVIGSHEIFAAIGPAAFSDIMSEIGNCVATCVKKHGCMMSYAGRGNFVCLTTRRCAPNPDILLSELNKQLLKSVSVFAAKGFGVPQISIGVPSTRSLFSMAPPTHLLSNAIGNASFSGKLHADPFVI